MAGVEITIDVDASNVQNALDRLLAFGENPFDFLDEVGGELVGSVQDRFDQGVGPDGAAWRVSERAKRTGGKTLKKSNLLAEGITHDANQTFVDVGSDKVYAAIHQFGGDTGRNKATTLPARPFLGVNEADEKMIEDVAFDFLRSAAGV